MRRNGEHEGRAFAELVLAGLALCALAVPLAWADDGRVERRTRAAALGLEVLAQVATSPCSPARNPAAQWDFRVGGPRRDHRVLGPRGENPLRLRPALAQDIAQSDMEVHLYFHREARGAEVAWVDVLDARVTRASGDPLAALLAHRSLRVTAPSSATGQVEVRDASL